MENINVFIRLKPLNYQDYSSFKYDKKNLINIKSKENFNFDSIISPITTNEILFENLFKDSLKNLLKGKNITIFTYGQSNTGKTFTLKGNKKNKGLILLSINEIFNLFSNNDIKKFNVKVCYFEIFNEIINDLIEINNKNLEILENNQKGIFINNLSEIQINNNNNEKIEQILNKKEINKIKSDSKEIKLNEKSNKNHLIFKIIIEYEKNDKKFISYLNFIDLAGSENLNKAKFEYIKNKEGSNMNKSLLAFNNIINKLSQNNKNCFINFRESKLTRLIQSIFNGNYKISFICNIIDDKEHYFETLNTIHFGLKAKNIKNFPKNFNENNNNKILIENNRLKNNIKYLEGLINKETGKKYLNNCLNKKNNNNINNNNNNNNKTENNLNNCQKNKINHLEKEVAMLKKFINKSEEISEINSLNNDIFSLKSGRNLCKNLLESEIKSNKNNNNNNNNSNRFNSLSAMRYTNESAIKNFNNNNNNNNDLFNSPFAPSFYNNNNNNNYLLNTEISNNNYYDNNNFRRACFTEMRPNNDLNNYNNNLAYNNNNNSKFFNFNSTNNNLNISNEIDFNNIGNDSNILRENEELKKTIYEMKKTYYDIIQSKEQQIKLLNQNHNLTIENCEKLIKEAEDNYLNLKVNYEQAMSENKNKENEIITLKQKFVNQETSINYYKDELDKFKDINYITEIEKKYNNLKEENDTLKNYNDAEYKKSIEENNILKEKIKELEDKIKNKNVDFESFKNQMDLLNKKNEKEIQKLKIENKNLKSVSSKQNNSNNKKKKLNSSAKSKIKEYETQIKNLQKENNEYKNNMKKIEQIQIIEYQKLLDESFDKINELNKQLFDSKDKVKYLEKALNIVEKTAKKYENEEKTPIKEIKLTNFNTEKNIQNFDLILNDKENDNNLNNIENKEFVNKKRYLPNIYESIAKKNDFQSKSNKNNNNNSNNNKNEISKFQI